MSYPFKRKFKITCEFKRKGNWIAGFHTGLDMVGIDDIGIYPTCQGQVYKVGNSTKDYGNYIVIKADSKYHWYCHLSRVDVKKGQNVDTNTLLGLMGSTRKFNWTSLTLRNKK